MYQTTWQNQQRVASPYIRRNKMTSGDSKEDKVTLVMTHADILALMSVPDDAVTSY